MEINNSSQQVNNQNSVPSPSNQPQFVVFGKELTPWAAILGGVTLIVVPFVAGKFCQSLSNKSKIQEMEDEVEKIKEWYESKTKH